MRTRRGGGGTTWRNWSGEQTCRPVRVVRPRSAQEVADVVRRAAADGLPVKAAGSGHSFTGVALTDGVLVDVGAISGIQDLDRATGLVRVGAGTTIHALSSLLADHGLGLENLGDIDRQTIAGAIATGTHGTGATLGNLPSQVRGVELVTGTGEIVDLDADGDPLALRAARVSVGALGIVTAVTLQAVPAYVLHGVDTTEPLEEVLASLPERTERHRHFEAYVFPHAPLCLTRTNDVVDAPAAPPSRTQRWLRQGALETGALATVSELGRRAPAAIPRLNRLVTRVAGTSVRTDRSDRIFASPRHVRFVEMEWALPRAEVEPTLREILALISGRGLPVNFPIEMRFVRGDDALLSPAHGRDTGYLAVHVYRDMPWGQYFRGVQEIALAHGGRPHWGKRHFLTADELAPRYPEWDAFAAVRARLDPDGRFRNPELDRVLGPVRAPEPAVGGLVEHVGAAR
ncbi:D-arabinono-1,4-lactone oxidase [Patulibacter sp. S7RM1-6]